MSSASLSLPDGLFAPHELVRELGARPNPVYVIRQSGVGSGGKPLLAVAERFIGAAKEGPGGEDLVRDARRIATLASPNVARVREVTIRGDDLVVLGEFVEGEKLQELWRPDKLPLEIALRVVVDALTGVGALHNLRDAKQQPMKLAHGELSPATIVLGLDGIARVLHAVSRRAPDVRPEPASLGYLSPEVASGDPYDARADIFSAGVLLWEALSEKRLFTEPDPRESARRVRSGALPPATVPAKGAWAKGVVEVVARALSSEPDKRWPTAAVMAAELRKAAGLKLAPASTAAAFAKNAFGERVRARRESLDVSSPPGRGAQHEPVAAAARQPPRVPAGPSEGSFLDVELESAVDTVLVAPGIRATVAEVVELGSEALMEASSQSSIPPAASPPPSGFVLDPFAARAVLAQSPRAPDVARAAPPNPPPLPAVTTAPVLMVQAGPITEEPPPPSVTGAPHFAAAIDVRPPPPLPPPAAPTDYLEAPHPVSPPIETQAEDAQVEVPGARRRRLMVLGGVGALGAVVLLLVALRMAHREPDVTPPTIHAAATTASIPQPAPSAVSAAESAVVPPAQPTPAASPVAGGAPRAQPTTPRATPPTAKPTPVVAAAPTRAAPVPHLPATAKPGPKPKFDPNSL